MIISGDIHSEMFQFKKREKNILFEKESVLIYQYLVKNEQHDNRLIP